MHFLIYSLQQPYEVDTYHLFHVMEIRFRKLGKFTSIVHIISGVAGQSHSTCSAFNHYVMLPPQVSFV